MNKAQPCQPSLISDIIAKVETGKLDTWSSLGIVTDPYCNSKLQNNSYYTCNKCRYYNKQIKSANKLNTNTTTYQGNNIRIVASDWSHKYLKFDSAYSGDFTSLTIITHCLLTLKCKKLNLPHLVVVHDIFLCGATCYFITEAYLHVAEVTVTRLELINWLLQIIVLYKQAEYLGNLPKVAFRPKPCSYSYEGQTICSLNTLILLPSISNSMVANTKVGTDILNQEVVMCTVDKSQVIKLSSRYYTYLVLVTKLLQDLNTDGTDDITDIQELIMTTLEHNNKVPITILDDHWTALTQLSSHS